MNEVKKDYPIRAEKLWLTFSNICEEGKFKVTLEINGTPFKEFYQYVGQKDGVVNESWNLTWLLRQRN